MGTRLRENVQHPFECFCEVGGGGAAAPRVLRTFPEGYRGEGVLREVPKFVYPCDVGRVGFSRFSFVLTCADSKWMYGFCRHDPSTPLALVFLSYLPLHDALYDLLDEMAVKIRRADEETSTDLISIADDAGASAKKDGPRFPEEIIKALRNYYFERPPSLHRHELPRIPKNANLTEYFCACNYKVMIGVMAALLHERRVVVRSRRPCRVSACVQAANDLLYPLVWQHIFIPVLPASLADYLLAPMPFLVGVPDNGVRVSAEDVGHVVVVDADRGAIDSPYDDVKDLPPEVVSSLLHELTQSGATEDSIPRAFLRTITYLIGGYKDALRRIDGRLQLDKEAFVASRGSSARPFLQKLTTLQTFEQFVESRIELIDSGAVQSDEFERECCNYERLGKSYMTRAHKISIGSIVRQVKEMTHPAVETAVESMKTGSRGVRTACRELRMRVDTTIHSDKSKQSGRLSLPGPSGFSKVKDSNGKAATHAKPASTTTFWRSKEDLNDHDDEYLYSSAKRKQSLVQSLPLPGSSSSRADRPFDEAHDLIRLEDSEVPTTTMPAHTDRDLLHEYGLDFEKFNISRRNWTTFEE